MLSRIITSIIGIAVMIPIMFFSHTYVFPAVLAFFCLISLYEIFVCIKLKGKLFITLPTYAIGITFPFLCKYIVDTVGNADLLNGILCASVVIYLVYLLSCAVLFHKKIDVNTLSICFILVVYIIGGFSSLQILEVSISKGIIAVLPVFIASWITDIFAYFTGRLFGKHKLCETISPKKTIEGSIGGTIFCAVFFAVYATIIFTNTPPTSGYAVGYILAICTALLLSVVAQFGDLFMSLIKRKFGIKDFGSFFPGHGGVLDRFDSILAVSPVFLIIVTVIKIIT